MAGALCGKPHAGYHAPLCLGWAVESMGVEEIGLEVNGLPLSAQAWGPVDGVPVLALHGWLDNSASFQPLAPLLKGIRLVAPDLPGHGHSAHRPGYQYHFADYVYDVLALAEALNWSRFGLLGHSLGAAVAAFAAAVAPERVAALGLLDGIGPISQEPDKQPEGFSRSVAQINLLRRRRKSTYSSLGAAVQMRLKAGYLSESSARLLAQRGTLSRADGKFLWRHDPLLHLASPFYFTEEQVLAFLRRITAPALLVMAESGLLNGRSKAAIRCESIANLEVVNVAGGHHVHMDAPEGFANIVERHFLTHVHPRTGDSNP